ncbi:MAG TPA: hypothetical protein VK991_03290 [Halomonas sp.]|nr:hypothetical protein [Halomonas sp.]
MSHYWKFAGARTAFFIAAASVVLLAGSLVGCGDQGRANGVTLAVLTTSPADYDNSQVITSGVVRRFEEPLHYWIEDDDLNRVEIFPHEKIAPYLGEVVLVEGRFRFSTTEGRRLTLTDIKRK